MKGRVEDCHAGSSGGRRAARMPARLGLCKGARGTQASMAATTSSSMRVASWKRASVDDAVADDVDRVIAEAVEDPRKRARG
ncbi:MAG: hypothetical protein R3B70_16360 [Polyangiaceae bacterium]